MADYLLQRLPRTGQAEAVAEVVAHFSTVHEAGSSCYDDQMKLVTAQVIEGKIDVPPEIADGARVAILAPDDGAPAALSPAEEQELSEALADIQAGRYTDGWALLEELKAKSRA